MKRVLAFVTLALFLAGTSALAQNQTTEDVTIYDFPDANIEGTTVTPEGVTITSRKNGSERSLIRIRNHFVFEMLKSVENI